MILNFDVNKTLIASDRAGGKSVDDVLNQLLAEKIKFCWDNSLKEPISFEEYVKNVLLPGNEYDQLLKKKRDIALSNFLNWLCKNNSSLYAHVFCEYKLAHSRLEKAGGIIFPSFYKLIEVLDKEGISYTIILRSFGSEVFEIAGEINQVTKRNLFSHDGQFKEDVLFIDNQQLKNPSAIYEKLNHLKHAAIRDDWSYWMKGKLASSFAKPFIIDQDDDNTLSLFFDDNINLDDNIKNIIAPIDAKTGLAIDVKKLAELHQIVRVDTLRAILDDKYYLDQVKVALMKHRQLAPSH